MKRSRKIGLVLLGGASLGALPACSPGPVVKEPAVSSDLVYANDHFIAGAGYYHAPFRGFYPRRYNEFDAAKKLYFAGGKWGSAPHQSVVNVSSPTPDAAALAQRLRADIPRAGFGSYSRFHGGGGYS